MIPNAAEILRRRSTAVMVVRLISLVVMLIALAPIGAWLAEGIADGDLFNLSYYTGHIVGVVIIVGPGVTLWALAPMLSRRMIPVPRFHKCPGCHYRLQGLLAPQCPECGLTLTPEFLTSKRDNPAQGAGSSTILLRQIMVLVIRASSMLAALPMVIYLLNLVVAVITDQYISWGFVLPPVVGSVLVFVGYFFATHIAALAIPDEVGLDESLLWPLAAFVAALLGTISSLIGVWMLSADSPDPIGVVVLVVGVGLIASAFPLARRGRAKPPPPGTPSPPAPDGQAPA